MSYGFSRDQWYNYIADRSHPPVASAVVEKPEYDPDHVYAWKPANNYKGWKLIARGKAGVDDAEVIQSAYDSVIPPAKICLIGKFEINQTIKGKSYVVLEGQSRVNYPDSPDKATIVWTGTDGGIMFDFVDKTHYGFHNVTLDGGSKAKTAIKTGAISSTNRTRYLDFYRVNLFNFTGVALDLGTDLDGKTDDTTFIDLRIQNADIGIAGMNAGEVKLIGGSIAGCKTAGIRLEHPAQIHCYGTIFSGNDVDIQYAGDDFVEPCSFISCWFENSTTAILNRPTTPATTKDIGTITFENCYLHTSGSYLFDLTNIKTILILKGGHVSGSSSSGIINVPESGTKVSIRGVWNANKITFSGGQQRGLEAVSLDLVRAAGSGVDGNAGTDYASLLASSNYIPIPPYEIVRAFVYYNWNPKTTSGGIRLYNADLGKVFGAVEPAATGWRFDVIDVTDDIRSMGHGQRIVVQTKGDGSTAPTIGFAVLQLEY